MKFSQHTYRTKTLMYLAIAFVAYTAIFFAIETVAEKHRQASTRVELLKQQADAGNIEVQQLSLAEALGPQYNLRPEMDMAMQKGEGYDIRQSPDGTRTLYYAQRTDNGYLLAQTALPYPWCHILNWGNILTYLTGVLFFVILMVVIILSSGRIWPVMDTLKRFVNTAEHGNIDYTKVHFPNTPSGETGNKIVELYKQLENSKLEIIKEKDLNRKMKQEMTNNIAHELKTPVSSIRGYLEILLGDKPIDDERRHYFLERSYSQTLRLSNLINDVSVINKIEESSELFQKEDINVRQIAQEAIDELADSIAEKRIAVSNSIPPEISIWGNHSLMYSIFRNLIENVVSYAGEDISIGMELHKEDNEYYYFRFYDTGCGVEEQYLTRLFDRFLRIDTGRSRKNGGTGLGLSIVKHAVQFHQGSIVAKNSPAGGLEFYFSFKKDTKPNNTKK